MNNKITMSTFTTGLTIGDRDWCMFSMDPLSEMTADHASIIGLAMAYLSDKVNQDPENLKEVIEIYKRLSNRFSPKVNVEMEKPLHVGVGYIVDVIKTNGLPVKPYFRQE